ncbi:MAG: 3-dehydroquinate synthase [Planctomycetes bacterium]|nr:3-dehydroquinate synthase [Planctomycetota bacterium]
MSDSSSEPASKQFTVHVELGPRSYDIVLVNNDLSSLASLIQNWCGKRAYLSNTPAKAIIITDRNVNDAYANPVKKYLADAGWNCTLVELEPGETSKRIEVASHLYDQLVEMKADRQTVVVAVGGGVVGDAAGFVAATYARGIPFVQVPTSLLAHVDSSVGGKVGINHPRGKNLIGAFYQPLGVFIDTATLQTLPLRDYRSGLAEVIKYGMILDEEFFGFLEDHIDDLNNRNPEVMQQVIARCCRLKADVVEQDEQERTGLRAVLNYGHTFAHAFEALCGYGELLHGEAVSIGMVYAGRLAERRKLINASVTERQIKLLEAVGLPVRLPDSANLNTTEILDRMKLDKKTVGGKLRFILPTCIGHVELFSDIPEEEVRDVLDELAN